MPKLLLITLLALFSTIYAVNEPHNGIKKVKDMNVLMPQIYEPLNNRKIKHDLQAYNGCYSWDSSNYDYFDLEKVKDSENSNCSSVCTIFLKTNQDLHNIIWITATDLSTKDQLQIETNIKPVHKIEILTKFRTIDVGDVQIFELIGFDQEGNSFSSLEGMRFHWTIKQENQYLEFIPLKESQIKTSQLRKDLENFHNPQFYTDQVAVIGKLTGKTYVTATINEKGYEKISHTVEVHVIQQFVVYPYVPLRLLSDAKVNYKLFYKPKISQLGINSVYDKIIMPNQNYNWNFDLTKIAQKDLSFKNTLSTLHQAQQKQGLLEITQQEKNFKWYDIYVKDMRSQDNFKKVQYSVVEPHHIDFQIKEYQESDVLLDFPTVQERNTVFENSWYLVKGRQYYIRAELYTEDNQLIYIAENTQIHFNIDKKYFDTVKITKRGEIICTPKTLGQQIDIQVQLKTHKGIEKARKVNIVLPIKLITPLNLHLPANLGNEQHYYIQYLGGSQQYVLSSSDPKIVSVAESTGKIVAQAQVGSAFVTVSDSKNAKNFVQISVEVSEVESVRGVEEQKEILENSYGYVYPVAYGREGKKFHNCTDLRFQMVQNEYTRISVEQNINHVYTQTMILLQQERNENKFLKELLSDSLNINTSEFQEYIKDNQIDQQTLQKLIDLQNNQGVCSQLFIDGLQEGNQIVQLKSTNQVRFKNRDDSNSYKSFDLKVFKPFKNSWKTAELNQKLIYTDIKSSLNQIVVAPGSSFQWNVEGGIDKWPNRHFSFNYDTLINEKPVKDQLIFQKQSLNTTFTCKVPSTVGKQYNQDLNLQMSAQNDADIKLPKPLKLQHSLLVSCSIPYSVHIYEFNTTSQLYSDEYREKLSQQDRISIKSNQINQLKVKAFNKQSHLFYNYTSLKFDWTLSTEKFGQISENTIEKTNANNVDIFRQFKSNEKVTADEPDELVLKVITKGFKQHSQKFEDVWDEVTLQILDNVKLVPQALKIYLYHNPHKNFVYNVDIIGGVGPFQIGQLGSSQENNILDIHHSEFRKIQVNPLQRGQQQIFVNDFKTIGSERAYSDIQVEDVANLVITINQNLIPEFNTTVVEVQALGEFGQPFNEQSYQYMDLQLEAEKSITSERTDSELLIFERFQNQPNKFIVQGKKRGLYRITAVLSQHKLTHRKSNFVELEVFSKLYAEPPQITMSPECQLGLLLKGGPSDLSNLELVRTSLKGYENSIEISEIEDKKSFQIKASKEFQKEINFKLKFNGLLLTEVTVPIRIVEVNRVKIVGAQTGRVLHLGTQIRLFAELYHEEYRMSTQICDYKILWESEQENVLRIYHQDNIYPENSEYTHFQNQRNFQLAVNTSAVAVGKTQVFFQLFTNKNQPLRSTSKEIEIIPHLSQEAPTYIAQDDVSIEPVHTNLLMPPNSRYTIISNKQNVEFKLFDTNSDCTSEKADKFELDESTGELFANTNKQRIACTVRINDLEKGDIMYSSVQTANIVSLFVQNSHNVFTVGQEKSVSLRLHLQDSFGRSFPTRLVGVSLSVAVTNIKVVEGYVSHDLKFLHIRTKSPGFSLVKVFLSENPNIYDIFRINVGSVITPESPIRILVGGQIFFKLSDKSVGKSQLRNWKSQDPSIVSIDSLSGKALAKQQGEVMIEVTDGMTHQARVVVSKIHEIILTGSNEQILTDMRNSPYFKDSYSFQFHIYGQDQSGNKSLVKELKSNKINSDFTNDLYFSCHIESQLQAQWFRVESDVMTNSDGVQTPYCNVKLPPLSTHQTSKQNAPDSMSLTVSLRNSQQQLRFQQKFDFSLRWLVKSREYYEKNKNNKNRDQQNNNQDSGNWKINEDSSNNLNVEKDNEQNNNNSLNISDHILVIATICVFIGFSAAKNNNQIEISNIFIGIIMYIVFYVFASWYVSQ